MDTENPLEVKAGARVSAWMMLAVFIAAWIVLDRVYSITRPGILAHFHISGMRPVVAMDVLANCVQMYLMFAGSVFLLHLRGQTLADVGWRRPATTRGWLWAVALAVLVSVAAIGAVGHKAQLLSDWSFYRISLALLIGVSAGVCQETLFRGFVMTQARDAGMPVAIQILLSAGLFGLALTRFNWVGMPAPADLSVVAIAATGPAILGAVLAFIYIVSRRSLTPAIFSHAMIDIIVEPGVSLLLTAPAALVR